MFIPEIPASKVAALIGLNRYQNPNEVIYSLLQKDSNLKRQIEAIEKEHNRRSYQKVVNEVLAQDPIRDCVAAGLDACKKTTDVTAVLESVEDAAKLILALRNDHLNSDLREQIAAEVRGKVTKQRGLNNEDTILNNYEKDNDVKVTERNTKMIRKNYNTFKIVGRLDGFVESENRIVDSKDRTRVWSSVPIYDEVQMRCYMDMTGASQAELVERFPDRTTRTTKYLNDPEKWKSIRDAIEQKVTLMNDMIQDAEKLKRIVFLNTVEA
jgi:hypothetical protein